MLNIKPVHYLNIEQPITVWSWHGWFRFGKTTSNMPSGDYGAVRT